MYNYTVCIKCSTGLDSALSGEMKDGGPKSFSTSMNSEMEGGEPKSSMNRDSEMEDGEPKSL